MANVFISTRLFLAKYDQTRLAVIFKYHSISEQKLWTSSLLKDNTFLIYIKKKKKKSCLIDLKLVSRSGETSKDILQLQEVFFPPL